MGAQTLRGTASPAWVFRALLAGMIGLAVGEAMVTVQVGEAQTFDDLGSLATLDAGFLGFVLLVTMIAGVVIEAVLRPRTRCHHLRIPRPVTWMEA